MARGTLRLGEALKDEKTFAPINMILRDPLRYGLRLWREYNLRARPMEFREIESPLDLCETQDIGDEYIDEWSVGMDPSDGWGSPPQDLDWSATRLKVLETGRSPDHFGTKRHFGKALDVSGALSLFLPFSELLVEVFSMNAANALPRCMCGQYTSTEIARWPRKTKLPLNPMQMIQIRPPVWHLG